MRSLRAAVAALVTVSLVSGVVVASPGRPDRAMHPYVGLLVQDLGNGEIHPYCNATLISSSEAVTAHHCAITGSEVLLTFDNPVVVPAQTHTGTVRLGGGDFGEAGRGVDVAIIDLHEPIELTHYAQLPWAPIAYVPQTTLDFVTYVAAKQSGNVGVGPGHPLPVQKSMQNEPAHVELDRNVIRTTPVPAPRQPASATEVVTLNVTCLGNSGSPIFLSGTNVIAGVMSWGSYFCTGGGSSHFSRTDSELARGILTGTVQPPPPPTVYPALVRGDGASGATEFEATIRAGAEYTAAVTGLSAASESLGEVQQDAYAVFPMSISPGFRAFAAALSDHSTSGNDDLDLILVWYEDGVPISYLWSDGWTSEELVSFSPADLEQFAPDDPYTFEVWVYGWRTEAASSSFTLFTRELAPGDAGNLAVASVTAGSNDPQVVVQLNWSGLDASHHMHFGLIDHALDGVPEPIGQSTFVQIRVPDQGG